MRLSRFPVSIQLFLNIYRICKSFKWSSHYRKNSKPFRIFNTCQLYSLYYQDLPLPFKSSSGDHTRFTFYREHALALRHGWWVQTVMCARQIPRGGNKWLAALAVSTSAFLGGCEPAAATLPCAQHSFQGLTHWGRWQLRLSQKRRTQACGLAAPRLQR